MFSPKRIRSLTALSLLLLGVLLPALATAAASNTGAVAVKANSGDRALLSLSKKTRTTFKRDRVTLRTAGVAKHAVNGYALPTKSGTWNFTSATGTVKLNGKLALHLAKKSVTFGSASLTHPAKGSGKMTAVVGGHTLNLFNVTGKAKVKHSGNHETLTGLTASLTKAGAAKINKALGRNVVKTGQSLGAVTVTVTKSASGSVTGTATPTSGVGISYTTEFRTITNQSGLSLAPVTPAGNGLPAPAGTTTAPGADGSSVTFPVAGSTAGASFDQGTLTGTIPLSGGLSLGSGTGSASLTNPQLTLGTGTEGSGLSFSVNGGPEVKLFDIDTSQLEQSTTSDGALDLQGLLATLSSEGAATLNTVTGTQDFTTGQPVGGLTVIVPASPGQGS